MFWITIHVCKINVSKIFISFQMFSKAKILTSGKKLTLNHKILTFNDPVKEA